MGDEDLGAGEFSPWLSRMQAALQGEGEADVPCDGCTACCTSSQFVHIAPDEADTLADIPAGLLFPAPRLPPGHVVLGYDERGHCPMLVEGACSIYEHRPRTCRTYDCRIFPAAGLWPDGPEKAAIATRAGRWRFTFRSAADRARYDAVRASARFLVEHRNTWPDAPLPADATALAVLALQLHQQFLGRDGRSGQPVVVRPDPSAVRVEVRRRR